MTPKRKRVLKILTLAAMLSATLAFNIQAAAISDSDGIILQKIALAEAEDHGVTGMALVMNVVINRVNSPEWPDTVEGVVFQKNQFSPISDGRYYKMSPNSSSREALDMVRSGWDESQGAEYFCEQYANGWHERHLKRLFQYKSHVFYR